MIGLGVTYEVAFLLSGLFSLAAVLLGGELSLVFMATFFVPFVSLQLKRKNKSLPPWFATILALGSLSYGGVELYLKGIQSIILAFSVTFVLLMSIRLLTREKPEHDLQSLLLGLFLLFAGTVLHTQISYAPVFLGYVVSTVWALIAWQLLHGNLNAQMDSSALIKQRYVRRDVVSFGFLSATTAVSFALIISTIIFFAFFPRIGVGQLSFLKRGSQRLPDSVDLSQNYRLSGSSGDIVARVKGVPYNLFEKGLYFRAQVYDQITGSGFSKTEEVPQATVPDQLWSVSSVNKDYEIFLQPVVQDRLLTFGPAQQAYILSGGGTNPSSIDMRIQGIGPSGELIPTDEVRGPVRYHVNGPLMLPFPLIVNQLKDDNLRRPERYKVLEYFARTPSRLHPAIEDLTERLLADDDKPWDIARKLRMHLYSNYTYSLTPSSGSEEDQIYNFLFSTRAGHCEYFAATFALMLRLAGVPARVVGGYQGGYWDDSDEVIIFTGKNAHVWIEWYHPRLGWVIDDATPVVYNSAERLKGMLAFWERLRRYWDDYVVEYNLDTQVAFISRIVKGNEINSAIVTSESLGANKSGLWLTTCAILFVLGFVWRMNRKRKKIYGAIISRLDQIFRILSSRKVGGGQTYMEAYVALKCTQTPVIDEPILKELKAILVLYHQYRFSYVKSRAMDWNNLDKRTKELWKQIKRMRS